uniref:Putative enoylreductase n=1 Tax=Alternaria solani TaxID=48100 RepID=A0A455XBS7_ALTSO|nr:putative enoylreductase [Alternaria solani]
MAVSTELPTKQAALKITGPGAVVVSTDVPLPELKPSDVLIRVACVSISPVDSKSADMSPAEGATSGTEFAGIVVAIGDNVDSDTFRVENHMQRLNINDRVVGGIFGNNPLRRDNGAFAEYVAVPARLIWHVPAGMDFGTAVCLPAAIATVGLSLFQHMNLPIPTNLANEIPTSTAAAGPWVLIHGGGTATGCMAIQVLKLCGFRTVTTCSSESAPRALRLGAAATFDYRSPDCGASVREFTSGELGLALDCITDTSSMALCYEALGPAGGRYVALDSFPLRGHTRRTVRPDWVCTYTQFGEPVAWAPPYNFDARPGDRRCAEAWYALAQHLLDKSLLEPHPKEERAGGLAAVADGMQEVRQGLVRGKKLVYPIAGELCAAA